VVGVSVTGTRAALEPLGKTLPTIESLSPKKVLQLASNITGAAKSTTRDLDGVKPKEVYCVFIDYGE
jgi:hypothetical protein